MPFTIVRDDLVNVSADAVVLPSNRSLHITGGCGYEVALIAGLRRVQKACSQIGSCAAGSSVAVPAFAFPAKHLICTVGPAWNDFDDKQAARSVLHDAYRSSLELALQLGCASIALPLLSAGSYGCPAEISLEVGLEAIKACLAEADLDITLVVYDQRAMRATSELYGRVAEYIDDTYVEQHEQSRIEQRGESRDSFGGSALRFCPVCGCEIDPDLRFCTRCGASLFEGDAQDGAMLSAGSYSGSSQPMASAAFAPAPAQAQPDHAFRLPSLSPLSKGKAEVALDALEEAAKPDICDSGAGSLEELLSSLDEPFSVTLLALIDRKGLKDSEVYKRANMSRQLFSKIRSDAAYKPTKRTALALCVALELSLAETQDLIGRAGFALSHSSRFDVIVEFFIREGNYDIFAINEALFAFDQPLLVG